MKKSYTAVVGLVSGLLILILSIMTSGDIKSFIDIPSVAVTLGGSFAALVVSFPMKELLKVPIILKLLLKKGEEDRTNLIGLFADMAKKA